MGEIDDLAILHAKKVLVFTFNNCPKKETSEKSFRGSFGCLITRLAGLSVLVTLITLARRRAENVASGVS